MFYYSSPMSETGALALVSGFGSKILGFEMRRLFLSELEVSAGYYFTIEASLNTLFDICLMDHLDY
jgi:hypothetical protein